jgi:hypothetical protein
MLIDRQNNNQRRMISISNSTTSNQLHFKKPWVVLWWSLAFPGFGHLMINSYIWGFFLISFEYLVNTISYINLSHFLYDSWGFRTSQRGG